MEPHYEIWGNWHDDSEHGVADQFLETCTSLEQVKDLLKQYRTDYRYAYAIDMEEYPKILDL